MKHAIIVDSSLNGREYGSLRSFEDAIIRVTGADVIELPNWLSSFYKDRMGHAMPLGRYRKFLRKKPLLINADVIWCVLMGPENYKLDLLHKWFSQAKFRIVYFFDTLQHQFPLIKRLFSNGIFNIKITSFNDAVKSLELLTNSKWHHIEQAVNKDLFSPIPYHQRNIAFSSYGRRKNNFHKVLQEFCLNKGLYYDYTTETNAKPVVSAIELYTQYAWHLRHSLFTVSWPVEVTHQVRAGSLDPITCRWFEASAAGTTIIGKALQNPQFYNYFPSNLICNAPITNNVDDMQVFLAEVWSKREFLFNQTAKIREGLLEQWTWENRVNKIMETIVL